MKYIHKNYEPGAGLNERAHKRSYTGNTQKSSTQDLSSSRDRSSSPLVNRSPTKASNQSPGRVLKPRKNKHAQSFFAIRNPYLYTKEEEAAVYTPTESVVYKDKVNKMQYDSIIRNSKESLLRNKFITSTENLYRTQKSPLKHLKPNESTISHAISQKTIQSLNENIIKLKKNLSDMKDSYIPHRSRPVFLSQANLYRSSSRLDKFSDPSPDESNRNSSPLFLRPKSTTRLTGRRTPLLSLNTFRDSESVGTLIERKSNSSLYEDNKFLGLISFGKLHKNSVNSILYKGNLLYSASSDYTIMKWNVRDDYDDLSCNERIKAHKRAVHTICSLKDNLFASGSADKTIKLWRSDSNFSLRHILQGHSGGLRCLVSPSPSTLISSSNDSAIRIWDIDKLSFTGIEYKEHIRPVSCLTLCNSSTLLSGSEDCTIKLWDTRSQWSIATYSEHIEPITSCCIWDDYSFLSSSRDGTVKVRFI
jgi:WD40 repeat protein